MHNLHFVVTRAEDALSACEKVESALESWGDENNWRSICGCVSADDEVFRTGEGRWEPPDDMTVAGINEQVSRALVSFTGPFGMDCASPAIKAMKKFLGGVELSPTEWYEIKAFARFKQAGSYTIEEIAGEPYDILKHTFRDWDFDEFGVTHVDMDGDGDVKRFVVFVDMHS